MVSGVMRLLSVAVAVLSLCFGLAHAADEVALPPLKARVTDLTGTLGAQQQAQLETTLAQIEATKGAQVAVLLLPTTQPEAIEQFGIRLAEAWKIGRKGVDDGVIIIVAKEDRATRIEVGYGLEGAIPDAIAKRIVSELMTPRFREGDFYGGLQAAADTIGKIIGGEPLPAPQQRQGKSKGLDGNLLPLAMMFIFVVGGILRAMLGRVAGAGVGGTIAFIGAWLLLGSLLAAIVVAVIAFVITMAGGGHGGIGEMGGMGRGGGFGGGGGGFGGGGASGRW